MARCILFQSKLSPRFWAEAVMTACYIRNRCPTRALQNDVPYTAWTGKVPTAAHFKTFGVIAHMLEKGKHLGKFDSKTRKCIFIGYSLESKAFRLWDPIANKILKSRDVKFLHKFQENEHETLDDFIDIEIMINSCNKESTSDELREERNENDLEEETNEEFHSANEEITNMRRESVIAHNENKDKDARVLPAMKLRKGRPKVIRTGKPGRPAKRSGKPAKRKQKDNDFGEDVKPAKRKQEDNEFGEDVNLQEDNEFEEDVNLADVKSLEENEEFAGLVCMDQITVEQALKSPEAVE